jgi:2-oxoglutarate ferredoxin oxidoreductase subunit gamma
MTVTEIRLAGSGGQGLILGARMLFRALGFDGRSAAQSQGYEPTSRGGFCHSDIVAAEGAIDYPLVTGLDCLLVLDQVGVAPSAPLLKPDSLVVTDARLVPQPPAGAFTVHALALTDTAVGLGSHRVANIVGLGALVGLGRLCSREALEEAIRAEAPSKFVDINLEAVATGFACVADLAAA